MSWQSTLHSRRVTEVDMKFEKHSSFRWVTWHKHLSELCVYSYKVNKAYFCNFCLLIHKTSVTWQSLASQGWDNGSDWSISAFLGLSFKIKPSNLWQAWGLNMSLKISSGFYHNRENYRVESFWVFTNCTLKTTVFTRCWHMPTHRRMSTPD